MRRGDLRLCPACTRDVAPARPLDGYVGDNRDNVDGDVVEVERVEEFLSIWIDLETVLLDVEVGYVGNVVVFALAFFFLQFIRDAANGTLLDAAHQVGGETGDFVSKTF